VPPTQQSRCMNFVTADPSNTVTYKNLALGVVTTDGTQALVAMTGHVCLVNARCWSNHDINIVTDSGQTFDQEYAMTMGSAPSSPFMIPLFEQDRKWYLAGF
jgi:hypothetical protein